jgi:nucleotide-binding universal stress UspA family protein
MSAPRHVLVGIDGSEDSRRALIWARDLVGESGGEIIAVHALGLLAHEDGAPVVPSPGYRHEVTTRLEQQWCRPLVDASVPHRCLVVDGDPVNALLTAASEQAADLVVVGRRGAGGHLGTLIGSASGQLVHRAHLPVVVVPPV